MSKKKPFEHEIDPELLAEIEEWEQQEHDEPEGYYFSNPDPYLKPTPLSPDHPRRNFWFDEDGHIRFLAAGVYLAKRDRRHDLLCHRHL